MSWQGIEGHDVVVAQFRQRLARDRLASTFLFVGPAGIGKRTFALKLAQALLCRQGESELLEPCGECASCVQVVAGTHPDVLHVRKPDDKNEIPIALLIGSKERRMQEGLCHDLWLKPTPGGRRIAILDDADHLNEEGANALLKTLEEPPPRAVLILVGTSVDRQLPTIRSRSQIVRFQPLPAEIIAGLLITKGLVADSTEAQRLAEHADGSLTLALELTDHELWTFRGQLLGQLRETPIDGVQLGRMVTTFVESAGKDAIVRRARARQVLRFAAEFFRQLARTLVGAPLETDRDLRSSAESAAAGWPGDAQSAAECVGRTLEAISQIDRYVNQGALLDCWADEVSRPGR